ncbi:MAG: tRNA lysidine(34) synthetase TilS [Phenylobacterium sp.]|uniref:tRNA lysidine(34) synthetase TilS n=1 Tax=Phenylobacterium sp. TaxID=1871053 RepID=UPI002736E7E8|nr:tRNA lysidine(34) synthetase TilS [Phenylobacterium sp.]MDP3747796.1 tRNA lysidine(34) synthetase TilS [Phenylobacterium sp.]
MRGLARTGGNLGCGGVLDRRLRTDSDRPLAVAVSGGGDSVALALIADAWARGHGRRLLILTVDHGLGPLSRDWTQACADLATRLGAGFQALSWTGRKPSTGLPAAAREARHRLIATAARQAGARVVLMGHTAGDRAEAQIMRLGGSTTPSPREWAPSPAWPEGRDIFLLRPLLGAGRAEIRAWLTARGETWIDDPANDDPRFARARARQALATRAAACPDPVTASPRPAELAMEVRDDDAGLLTLPREALRQGEIEAFVGAACLCASGTSRPPRGDRTARLAQRLRGHETFAASLAGARIEAGAEAVRFLREPGEMTRRGLEPLVLEPGHTEVWDGRFEITADRTVTILPLAGLAARLPPGQRQGLADLPPSARQGLPVVVDGDRVALAAGAPGLTVRALAHARLMAACGAVAREP